MRGWTLWLSVASTVLSAELAYAQRRVVGTYTGTIVEINDAWGAPPAVSLGMPVTGSFYYGISPVEDSGLFPSATSYSFAFDRNEARQELIAGPFHWNVHARGRVSVRADSYPQGEDYQRFTLKCFAENDLDEFPGSGGTPGCDTSTLSLVIEDEVEPLSLLRGLYLPTGVNDLDPSAATSMSVEIKSITLSGPGLVDTYCVSSLNSVGPGATLNLRGSQAVEDENRTLLATGGVASELGMFFYGSTTDSTPFGAGWLCVGGQLFRLPWAGLSDAAGEAQYTLDWNQPPLRSGPGMITPGSTWYFQYWYRDPGHGFNLSNGLRVVFFP